MIHGDITYVDEALYQDKLSVVYDDRAADSPRRNSTEHRKSICLEIMR